jgi:RNase P/RNase MRP subunit p29
MTKHLEDTLGLPNLSELANDSEPTKEDVVMALEQANDLEKQFSKFEGFDMHDKEMDELAVLAITAHNDLQQLGMNVEVKYAGEIFSSSSNMLKIAVDAKHNKVEKKLKLLRLQLEKMRIDKLPTKSDDSSNTIDGNALRMDRNDMLKLIRQSNNEDK